MALPGVGRKTAACVLLFALGMREVPVDTHVSRVGWRLGLFRPSAPFEELHDTMLEITPPGEELEFHLNLLRHGRRTCHAQRPECRACALRRMCPSADAFDYRRARLALWLVRYPAGDWPDWLATGAGSTGSANRPSGFRTVRGGAGPVRELRRIGTGTSGDHTRRGAWRT